MNNKILALVITNIELIAGTDNVTQLTAFSELGWTDTQTQQLQDSIYSELGVWGDCPNTVGKLVNVLDIAYRAKNITNLPYPAMAAYTYSGNSLVAAINAVSKSVLCIDSAQYAEAIPGSVNDVTDAELRYDHILAMDSLQFNGIDSIKQQVTKYSELLTAGGKLHIRSHPTSLFAATPYIDAVGWSFKMAIELARENDLTLSEFKKDVNDSLYIVYLKK